MKIALTSLGIVLLIFGVAAFQTQSNYPSSSGGSFTAAGDLSGTSATQTVIKVNGAAVPASGFGLKTNSSSQFVAAPASYASGTVTGSIAAITLCTTTNCPAGNYLVTVYVNETGTGCTTVTSGAVKVQLNFVDNQAVSRASFLIPVQSSMSGVYAALGLTLTTTGAGVGTGQLLVNTNGSAVAGSDSIQILTTLTACATPGPWTGYQVRAFITPVG